jgi:hypothetical protein
LSKGLFYLPKVSGQEQHRRWRGHWQQVWRPAFRQVYYLHFLLSKSLAFSVHFSAFRDKAKDHIFFEHLNCVFHTPLWFLYKRGGSRLVWMKQISAVEEKPFTSSLNICPETCLHKGVKADGMTLPPLHIPFYQLIRGYLI